MYKTTIAVITTSLALLLPTYTTASESRLYMGLDYGEYAYDLGGVAGTYTDESGYSVRLGFDLNNILALEGHLIKPGSFRYSVGSATQKFDFGASLYLRANMRLERVTGYLLGGATYLKDNAFDNTEVAYGAGLDLYATKNTALTLSYIVNYDGETTSGNEEKVSSVNFGFIMYLDPPKFSSRY